MSDYSFTTLEFGTLQVSVVQPFRSPKLLDKSHPGVVTNRACEDLGMKWLQLDFWKHFLPREKNINIVTLADELISMLQAGGKIMVHCAGEGWPLIVTLALNSLQRLQ